MTAEEKAMMERLDQVKHEAARRRAVKQAALSGKCAKIEADFPRRRFICTNACACRREGTRARRVAYQFAT